MCLLLACITASLFETDRAAVAHARLSLEKLFFTMQKLHQFLYLQLTFILCLSLCYQSV